METEIPTSETQEVLEPTIEDMIQAENGVPFTTSLAIAQAFEKEHKKFPCPPHFPPAQPIPAMSELNTGPAHPLQSVQSAQCP